MSEMNRTQSVVQERAVLVGVLLPERPLQEDPLAELAGLAETAGAQVVGTVTQRRESPDVTTYLGKGKVEELKALVAGERCRLDSVRQRPESGPDT